MRMTVKIESHLNRSAIRARVQQGRDRLVERVAKEAAVSARFYAPYDSGLLESTIEAVYAGPGVWDVTASTPYALIQELRQPYLYPGCLDALQQIQRFAREILG